MSITIAFSGKGGAGKTTLACLAIRYFLEKKNIPILAIDADPNSNLNVYLGMEFRETIADVREEILEKKVPEGEVKSEYIFRRMNEILVEGEDVDLLVMGRPEGPGCYCAVNHLLRDYLDRLSKHYRAIVMDTEAGMEHLSRKTTNELGALFIVATPDPVSLRAASRIQEIAKKLRLKIKNIYLILNRVNSEISPCIKGIIDGEKLNLIGAIPEDNKLKAASEEGTALITLSNADSHHALNEILDKLK